MDEFAETLETLQVNRNAIYLCGDFNIDLLKINTKIHYNTFYNNLIAAGYLPRISLPTRVTNHSATLLDNIFSTEFGNNDSGVIVNNISDHQMIYTYSTLQERAASTSHKKHIDGHESKPANSNFSKKFLFDKFEGNTFLHNVLKNLVPSMSLYPTFRQLSKPAISHSDTFQRNKTG